MALPKIQHPTFKIKIPSTQKDSIFRPYTVREEKLLLMMQGSKNLEEAVDVLKQIITNCNVSEDVNVDKLALFDIEYLFVKIRSKSVDEHVDLVYNFGGEKVNFKVNLEEVEVVRNPEHQQKFIIHENIGVCMKYPTFSTMLRMEQLNAEDKLTDDFMFDMFIDCIDYIFDNDQIYQDFTKEELTTFVLSLPSSCSDKIETFFSTIPSLEHKVSLKKKDGTVETVVLRGLKDFFIL